MDDLDAMLVTAPAQGLAVKLRRVIEVGDVSNVDIDGNNTL